jgi:signal transduction histidine kinase
LTGFTLALVIALHIWTIFIINRQNTTSILAPLYIYLNILMVLVETSSLFFLKESPDSITYTIFKIHYVIEVFIPPILIYLTETYLDGQQLPRMSFKNVVFFGTSVVLSAMGVLDLTIGGVLEKNGIVLPEYTAYYWIYIIYFYIAFSYILVAFLSKYQSEKRQIEIANIKYLLIYLLPGSILAFTLLKLFPMWNIIHPAVLLSYPVISLGIFSIAIKFQIIDLEDSISRSISFFLLSILYIILSSILLPPKTEIIFILTIPIILGLLVIFRAFDVFSVKKIKERTFEAEYDLEDELVTLFSETEKYIDNQALAQFIGELSLKVLNSQKCVVITSRFDVKPYQVSYLNGFQEEDIENLLATANSPFIETMEFNQAILNKFELSPSSALYQLMDRYNIYLGIPMASKNNLQGLILLGGDRKLFHITAKDLKFAKFLSIKAGSAFENIQEIQKVVQSQKMADLGIMASQLAHDFQSFITLVKLQTKGNEPLRQHASHMEKMVKDLLNYTRPKDLRLTSVNINQLIDMSLDLVELPPTIIVEKHYSESVPLISVDVDQMRRVFVNLFENSIKSIHQNRGRLKISTRPLRPLSNFRRNTWLYLEILDDGEGIPEEFLEKIFDPFFTTRKKEGGSGMGLAIVKQIITSHQGSIDVTSKLDKGTIFNIRLPYLR